MTYTPPAILPCDHANDTGRTHPPIELLRALSAPADWPTTMVPPIMLFHLVPGPDAPPPVVVEFLTLADVADRVQAVGWV